MFDLLPNWLFTLFVLGVIVLIMAFIRDRISLSQLALYCLILIGLTLCYIKMQPNKPIQQPADKLLQNMLNNTNQFSQ